MKKQAITLTLCTLLLLAIAVPLVFADVSLSSRFDDVGNYGMVAAGVGLNGVVSGDITIDVPGTVVVAYLYWAGVDYKPGGVNQAVFDGTAITADFSYEEDFWFSNAEEYYHYVYGKDVTTMISSGLDTYTFSGIDGMLYPYGAGLVVVYEDLSLPVNRVVLKDGSDGFHFDFAVPNGPNSEVVSFDFDSASSQREGEMLLIVGGTEHDDRPNEIWTETGSGSKPTDLITTPTSVGGPYPLYGSDGRAWDTYSDTITVNTGDEWLCAQIESIVSDGSGFPEFIGRGTSGLLIATGFTLPIEERLPGLSPGFWKHNIRVALGYPGGYAVPHEGEPRITYDIISGYASAIGVSLEDALDALCAKGPGSEAIRLEMCNAFNDAAGYEPYSD